MMIIIMIILPTLSIYFLIIKSKMLVYTPEKPSMMQSSPDNRQSKARSGEKALQFLGGVPHCVGVLPSSSAYATND